MEHAVTSLYGVSSNCFYSGTYANKEDLITPNGFWHGHIRYVVTQHNSRIVAQLLDSDMTLISERGLTTHRASDEAIRQTVDALKAIGADVREMTAQEEYEETLRELRDAERRLDDARLREVSRALVAPVLERRIEFLQRKLAQITPQTKGDRHEA